MLRRLFKAGLLDLDLWLIKPAPRRSSTPAQSHYGVSGIRPGGWRTYSDPCLLRLGIMLIMEYIGNSASSLTYS